MNSLNEDELHNCLIDIMSQAKLITGVLIHEGPLLQAQVKMLKIFLWTGYGSLTSEEIIQAFYLNLQGKYDEIYRHYQKELNCEFLGDVLRAYLKYKLYIRENRGPLLRKLINTSARSPVTIDYHFFKNQIQNEYDCFRAGRPDIQLWHTRKYYTLRKFGLLPFRGLETWFYFMKKGMGLMTGELLLPPGANISKYGLSTVKDLRALFKTSEAFHRCVLHARKFSYWYILEACKDCGINNLWEDITAIGHRPDRLPIQTDNT